MDVTPQWDATSASTRGDGVVYAEGTGDVNVRWGSRGVRGVLFGFRESSDGDRGGGDEAVGFVDVRLRVVERFSAGGDVGFPSVRDRGYGGWHHRLV